MNKNIITLANKIIKEDGLHDTFIKEIKLFKTSKHIPKAPLTYDLTFILVLQGKKIAYIPNNSFEYDSKKYLVVPTVMPFLCETIASEDEPCICMMVSIEKKLMYDVIDSISNINIQKKKKENLCVFSDKMTSSIDDIIFRLLTILQNKQDSKVLRESILKELYYRVATGEKSDFLYRIFSSSQNEAKIIKSTKLIHDDFNKYINISELAREVDMSISSFHTHFKNITSYTPLQYIRNIRLNKAKDMIAKYNYQVTQAAYEVGYESISQFSKDFKSYFGYPPKDAKLSYNEYEID